MEQRRQCGKDGADRVTLASGTASPLPAGNGRDNGTTPQLGGTRNRIRQRRGADLVARATRWEEENPDTFRFIEGRALAEAEAQRPVSLQALICEARAIDFTDEAGGRTRINNDLAAPLARRLRAVHPEIAPWLKLRQSMADEAER